MTYTQTVKIKKTEFDRINRLLAIESLEDMTDSELRALGANTDVNEGIFCVNFQDGSSLNFDLCSGTSNYYDDVVWTKDNMDVTLDCAYELDDIEFEVDGTTYIVKLDVIDELANQISSVLNDLKTAKESYTNPTDVDEAIEEAIELIETLYEKLK